jgi:hypothetical protein
MTHEDFPAKALPMAPGFLFPVVAPAPSEREKSQNYGTTAISFEELKRFAPSVLTSQPIAGVSNRDSFLPTSSILEPAC